MSGAIPPLPQYGFMAWYLVKRRDNFTFLPNSELIYNILPYNVHRDVQTSGLNTQYKFIHGLCHEFCGSVL
jgi:hypothetical protein